MPFTAFQLVAFQFTKEYNTPVLQFDSYPNLQKMSKQNYEKWMEGSLPQNSHSERDQPLDNDNFLRLLAAMQHNNCDVSVPAWDEFVRRFGNFIDKVGRYEIKRMPNFITLSNLKITLLRRLQDQREGKRGEEEKEKKLPVFSDELHIRRYLAVIIRNRVVKAFLDQTEELEKDDNLPPTKDAPLDQEGQKKSYKPRARVKIAAECELGEDKDGKPKSLSEEAKQDDGTLASIGIQPQEVNLIFDELTEQILQKLNNENERLIALAYIRYQYDARQIDEQGIVPCYVYDTIRKKLLKIKRVIEELKE